MNDQLKEVNFEIIRYANLWEDADVLLEGLNLDKKSKVMSIASAGDNCFSMLSKGIKSCIAVDVSLVQLHLVELKKVAIQQLKREDYMGFVGFTPSENRWNTYQNLKQHCSEACVNYWNHHNESIHEGVIHVGKFERYFQLFKSDYLHKIHSQAIVDELFEPKEADAQRFFHDEKWHTNEWKEMYRFFFGKQMMGDHGRDPEFLKHVKGDVSDIILAQEVDAIRKPSIQDNYFLYYILNNRFDEGFLPHYVRAENYENVKANLDALVLHHGLLDSALEIYNDCTHFNLSDIFEYMDDALFHAVSANIIANTAPNAMIAYWNLMIPRSIAKEHPEQVTHLKELSNRLKAKDKGYFYQNFIIDQLK